MFKVYDKEKREFVESSPFKVENGTFEANDEKFLILRKFNSKGNLITVGDIMSFKLNKGDEKYIDLKYIFFNVFNFGRLPDNFDEVIVELHPYEDLEAVSIVKFKFNGEFLKESDCEEDYSIPTSGIEFVKKLNNFMPVFKKTGQIDLDNLLFESK